MVCGNQNDFSLNTRFYEIESEELVAIFRTEDHHQSYPGRTHGGIAAAILDETIGRAVCIKEPDTWAVTVELCVSYKSPLPTEANLKAIGRVTKSNRKIFEGTGEILLEDGTVAVTAKGKYMKMPADKIIDHSFMDTEWYLLDKEDDPDSVEI